MPDRVTIRIPASSSHIGLVRAAAGALGALQDFTYDGITDLQIAIDEVCGRILASSEPSLSRLEVTFEMAQGGLEVSASGDAPLREGAQFLNPLARAILESVATGLELMTPNGTVRARFSVVRG